MSEDTLPADSLQDREVDALRQECHRLRESNHWLRREITRERIEAKAIGELIALLETRPRPVINPDVMKLQRALRDARDCAEHGQIHGCLAALRSVDL